MNRTNQQPSTGGDAPRALSVDVDIRLKGRGLAITAFDVLKALATIAALLGLGWKTLRP